MEWIEGENAGLAMREIRDTEAEYLKSLESLLQSFIRPMAQEARFDESMSEFFKHDEIVVLVAAVDRLRMASQRLLKGLEAVTTSRELAEVFLRFQAHIPIFADYAHIYPSASAVVRAYLPAPKPRRISRSRSRASKSHRRSSVENSLSHGRNESHQTFDGFLLKPIQRIAIYELLLKKVMSNLTVVPQSLECALQKLTSGIEECNSAVDDPYLSHSQEMVFDSHRVHEADTFEHAFSKLVVSNSAPAWYPGELASNCSLCVSKFSTLRRKHHCRHCGSVVCGSCSSRSKPIPGSRVAQRICSECYASPNIRHTGQEFIVLLDHAEIVNKFVRNHVIFTLEATKFCCTCRHIAVESVLFCGKCSGKSFTKDMAFDTMIRILNSEKSYSTRLKRTFVRHIVRLLSSVSNPRVALFCNVVNQLSDMHDRLVRKIEDKIEDWVRWSPVDCTTVIFSMFEDFSMLLSSYILYALNLSTVLSFVTPDMAKQIVQLDRALLTPKSSVFTNTCFDTSLIEVFGAPLRRLSQYRQLISIMRAVSPKHNHANLDSLISGMRAFEDVLTEAQAQGDGIFALKGLEDRFAGLPFPLTVSTDIVGQRVLVKESLVAKDSYVHLFSDVLLFSKQMNSKFSYDKHVALKSVTSVEVDEEHPTRVNMSYGVNKLSFVTLGSAEALDWVQMIQSCLAESYESALVIPKINLKISMNRALRWVERDTAHRYDVNALDSLVATCKNCSLRSITNFCVNCGRRMAVGPVSRGGPRRRKLKPYTSFI